MSQGKRQFEPKMRQCVRRAQKLRYLIEFEQEMQENKIIFREILKKLDSTDLEVSQRQVEIMNQIFDPNYTMSKERIPAEFICPLTEQMLNVPVVNQYGNSYEEEKYRSYVALHNKDPVSGKPIVNGNLYTNFSLIDAIDDFLQK